MYSSVTFSIFNDLMAIEALAACGGKWHRLIGGDVYMHTYSPVYSDVKLVMRLSGQ